MSENDCKLVKKLHELCEQKKRLLRFHSEFSQELSRGGHVRITVNGKVFHFDAQKDEAFLPLLCEAHKEHIDKQVERIRKELENFHIYHMVDVLED